MRITNFQKVKELMECRAAYKEQMGLISEQCTPYLVVAVRGGSEKKTQPKSYHVQNMLRAIVDDIEANLVELGVEL